MMASNDNKCTVWYKLQNSPHAVPQLQNIYGTNFPIEVRHFCAHVIENQPWFDIDEDNSDHEQIAAQMCESLVTDIQEKAAELNSESLFLAKLKLQQCVIQFREHFGPNPMELVRIIKNNLSREQTLLEACSGSTQQASELSAQADRHKRITDQIVYLSNLTQQTEEMLRSVQQEQENFVLNHQEYTKVKGQIDHIQKNLPMGPQRTQSEQELTMKRNQMENMLTEKATGILNSRMGVSGRHREIFEGLKCVQPMILDDELLRWKRNQQLAGNGAPFDCSLEKLQYWCDTLAEVIWTCHKQLKKVELQRMQLPINPPQGQEDPWKQLQQGFCTLLHNLVTSSFIIDKQPPQVLKKDSKFTAAVRLLVGGKLHVHMNPPTVKAYIISEEQARNMLKHKDQDFVDNSGEIVNNESQMEYHQSTGYMSVTFRNMQLKKIKRAERRGNETVTEEKFSILFKSNFPIGGGELMFKVWTLSLPVVVTVHGNQECNALATILWDNAFAESGRIPFHVPDKVTWPMLAEGLNVKFKAAAGRGLSQENLNYLAWKLFGPADDYTNHIVTWTTFNREVLPERSFTFWEWFYSIIKLTKEWLHGPWKEGLIEGFIGRQQAQDRLLQRPNGTFLLRFSDSECGGVTIAWVAQDTTGNFGGERLVWNLTPFSEKDFRIRSLGDRIKDLKNLVCLYPDREKNIFSKFWTSEKDEPHVRKTNRYVPTELVTKIPEAAAGGEPAPPMVDPQSPQVFQVANSPAAPNSLASPASVVVNSPMGPAQGAAAPPDVDMTFDVPDDVQDLFDMVQDNSGSIEGLNNFTKEQLLSLQNDFN